ncbi:MAG: serine/threonine protein kinase [Myxococcaceae bacterium]|nr:MAG: serine/threonine protein kinase [Myxococcaceae bacterium]
MSDPVNVPRDSFLPSSGTSRVGQYDLLTPLGKGGMAYVYLARKMGSGGFERLVAVKVMHRNIAADEEFVQMFLDEARLAARIHHPNVVPILDLGNDDGLLYMVMDYIEGDTLAAIQRTAIGLARTIPVGISLRIVLDALIGLDAAHNLRGPDGESLQLIHRDVSPQNILVGSDGAARLVDFGIARAERRLSLTSVGMLKGKAPFMAPEQLEGGVVDRRADVFSMGVTLWETLALRRCFPARSRPDLLQESLRAPYRSLLMFTDQIPEVLDGLCEKALAYDPDDRYPTAAAFADAIEANFRADIATQRQVGQFMSAVVADKIGREREAVRNASTRTSGTEDSRSRPSPDPHSVLGRVDSAVKSVKSNPDPANTGLRHRADSIKPLELRAPTPPPSLELQTSVGLGPVIPPNNPPMRAPTPAPTGDRRRLQASDHELSDQPTRVKQAPLAAPGRASPQKDQYSDLPEMPKSDSMMRLPDLPDLEAATSVAKHQALQRPAVTSTESRSEAPRKAGGSRRFSTMAGGGLPHTRAPTPATGTAAPNFGAPSRISATEDSAMSRPRAQPRPEMPAAPPAVPVIERVARPRPPTMAGMRVPTELRKDHVEELPRALNEPGVMRAPTPPGTPRQAPLGLRAPTPPGGRPQAPQNFNQLEALISTAPAEIDEHEAPIDMGRGRAPVRREPDASQSAAAEPGASVMRAPTPAGVRARSEHSNAEMRPVTPALGRAKLPLTMPVPSVPPEVEDGEAELERHRVRPQAFVEPPTGLPLFARVAIALVLFALLSFAGWHLMHQ